jgi:uncharacterized membrane protein YfhO
VSNKIWSEPEWFVKNAAITSCENCQLRSTEALLNSDEVKVVSYQNNRIKISVKTDSPGYLILNDKYDSAHWRVRLNDQLQETPILRANVIFRAVPIDQNTNMVEFEFVPPTMILFGTLLGLLIMLLALRRLN